MRRTPCDYACPTCDRPWRGTGRCTACVLEEDEERAVWADEYSDEFLLRHLTGEFDKWD